MFGLYVVCGNSIKNRRTRLTTGIGEGNINLMFIRKIKEERSYSNINVQYTYDDSVHVCVAYLSCPLKKQQQKNKHKILMTQFCNHIMIFCLSSSPPIICRQSAVSKDQIANKRPKDATNCIHMFDLFFLSPLQRSCEGDIVTLQSVLPSIRNILVNNLESTSFNGF